MQTKFLRTREVLDMIGITKPTLYKWIAAKTFPQPVAIAPMRIGFVESEVHEWMEARIADRTAGAEERRARAMAGVRGRM